MKIEDLKRQVHDLIAQGKTPRTLLLTRSDAKEMNIPLWTKKFLGLDVVIADNWPTSQVVPHIYEKATIKKIDEKDLKEYQESKGIIIPPYLQ